MNIPDSIQHDFDEIKACVKTARKKLASIRQWLEGIPNSGNAQTNCRVAEGSFKAARVATKVAKTSIEAL